MNPATPERPGSAALAVGRHRITGTGPTSRKLLAALMALVLALATMVLGAGAASAGLNPGSHPGAGQVDVFSDGGTHNFGAWRLTAGGVQGYCIDAQRTQPDGGTTYSTSTSSADPEMAYLVWKYSTTGDSTTGSALAWLVHADTKLPHNDAAPYEFINFADPTKHVTNVSGIQARINSLRAEAAAHSGPLTVRIKVTTSPTATNPNGVATVEVINSGGVDQAGYVVHLSGASGLPATVTSGAAPVKVGFTAANSSTGKITGSATDLPPTNYVTYNPANGAYQRLIVGAGNAAGSGAANYARPAVPNGGAQALKVSSATGAVLAGAVFHVAAGSTTGGADQGTLVTGANGKSGVLSLKPGTYTMYETGTPAGYAKNAPNVTFTVTTGKTSVLTFKDSPLPGSAQALKVSSASGAVLAGAVFHVAAGSSTGGADQGTLVTGANGKSAVLSLKPGIYTMYETGTPAGYAKNAPNVTFTVTSSKTSVVKFADSPLPGSAQAIKESSTTSAPLAGAVFHVSTGSSKSGTDQGTLVTGADGKTPVLASLKPGQYFMYETKAAPGYNLDAAGQAFTVTSGKTSVLTFKDSPVVPKASAVSVLKGASDTVGTISGKFGPLAGTTWTASSSDGLTVLGSGVTDQDGTLTIQLAVPPGTDVLLTETNTGSPAYTKAAPQHVTSTLDGSGTGLYTAVDQAIPTLATTLTNKKDGTGYFAAGDTGVDAVAYTGLYPGSTATAKGSASCLNSDGTLSPIPGAVGSTPFTASATGSGTVNVPITLPASMTPCTITVYEQLLVNGSVQADHNKTGSDIAEQGHMPTLATTLTNARDGSGFFKPGDTGTDAVAYTGLPAGSTATVKGSASCLNSDGSLTPIPTAAGTASFTASATGAGTVDVSIPLPASLAPCTITIYEQLVVNGSVASDNNKAGTDVSEQGHMTALSTSLSNQKDGSGFFTPGDTGVDAVAYLLPAGTKATVKGSASCLNSDGSLTPIPGAVGSTDFTAAAVGSGTVNVTIPLPASMTPCTITIYDQLIVGGVVRSDHNKNGLDHSEQGHMPGLATTLTNKKDGGKFFAWGDTGVDAVSYSGLPAGTTATANGTAFCLNSDGSQSPIPGATGSSTFTAAASGSGVVKVDIKIPNQLGTPCTITIHEQLLIGGHVAASHNLNGLNTTEQGLMPTLKTTLVGPGGGKATVIDASSTKLVDQVSCFNVIVGDKYWVDGTLQIDDGTVMGKATGVTGASPEFTAMTSALCTTVTFRLTGTLLPAGSSATVVAFEYLHSGNGALIASHTQIKDSAQALTVTHPGGGTVGGGVVGGGVNTGLGADNTSSTGDIVAGALGLGAVVLLLVAGAYVWMRRRRVVTAGDISEQ
ncbi:hypothetical protein ABIB25_000928 [Nakamurella sp. UYEF19]|uniref:SpaA isopeptide-forming pilin-related protein n=1 Tax=Nakamurella sp. UYEF19 TaxID=1756392 RepID=UPI0033970A30